MDIRILSVCQKFAEWSQIAIGLTNFWWARFFLRFDFVCSFTSAFFIARDCMDIEDDRTRMAALGIIGFIQLITVILFIFLSFYCTNAEKEFEFHTGTKRNHREISLVFIRLIFILFSGYSAADSFSSFILLGNFLDLVQLIGSISFILYFYFISCTPLPPQTSEVYAAT